MLVRFFDINDLETYHQQPYSIFCSVPRRCTELATFCAEAFPLEASLHTSTSTELKPITQSGQFWRRFGFSSPKMHPVVACMLRRGREVKRRRHDKEVHEVVTQADYPICFRSALNLNGHPTRFNTESSLGDCVGVLIFSSDSRMIFFTVQILMTIYSLTFCGECKALKPV